MSVSAQRLATIGSVLNDPKQPLKARFRALYTLRNIADDNAVELMGKAFADSSPLLKHEVAYCLGQTLNPRAIPIATKVINDIKNQEAIVRHEAGEAMGAIGDPSAIHVLESHLTDESPAVAQTCELALARIRWSQDQKSKGLDGVAKSPFNSVDPSPAAPENDVKGLQKVLTDSKQSLWNRYRAMFKLRDLNTNESILALGQGLKCDDSALFRHEVAYAMGQTRNPAGVPALRSGLENLQESHLVRHECAEALGGIGTIECEKLLQKYIEDNEREVRETCIVAMDKNDYENLV